MKESHRELCGLKDYDAACPMSGIYPRGVGRTDVPQNKLDQSGISSSENIDLQKLSPESSVREVMPMADSPHGRL